MDYRIVISDETDGPIGARLDALLREVARRALETEGIPADAEVGLTFVDDEEMARLNGEYRGRDETTDVLSFPLFERAEIEQLRVRPEAFPERPILLGDVVISTPTASRQAVEYGHDYSREVAFLFVHGLLHLLGYDHDEPENRTSMRQAEEAVLEAVGLKR